MRKEPCLICGAGGNESCDPAIHSRASRGEYELGSPYYRAKPQGLDDIPGIEYLPVEALRRVAARCKAGVEKHGTYDPLRVKERLEKCARHWWAVANHSDAEDHLAAIAANALFAMKQEEIEGGKS